MKKQLFSFLCAGLMLTACGQQNKPHAHGMRTAEQTSNDYGFRRQRKGGTL